MLRLQERFWDFLSTRRLPLPEQDGKRCLRRRSDDGCSRCALLCPTDAIALNDSGIELDAERCCGCTLCASVCPTEHLQFAALLPGRILRELHHSESRRLVCSRSRLEGVKLPCLGGLSQPLWIGTLLSDPDRPLEIDTTPCPLCPIGESQMPLFTDRIRRAERLLKAIGINSCRVERVISRHSPAAVTPEGPPSQKKEQRIRPQLSELRTKLGQRLRDSATELIARDKDQQHDGSEPLDTTPLHFLTALLLHSPPEKRQIPTREGSPWASLRIDPSCDGCAICSRVCPTEALQWHEERGEKRLYHRTARCPSECKLCLQLCPKGSLKTSAQVTIVELQRSAATATGKGRRLISFRTTLCSNCGEEMLQPTAEKSNPVGSTTPSKKKRQSHCRFCAHERDLERSLEADMLAWRSDSSSGSSDE